MRHLHDLSDVWQIDITYIQLPNHRWVYLANVLDSEKIRLLGCKIGDTMTAELTKNSLNMSSDKHRNPIFIQIWGHNTRVLSLILNAKIMA